MKLFSKDIILFLLFCMMSFFQDVSALSEAPKVLLLHSYNKELSWTDYLNNAIVESLNNNNSGVKPDVRIEYMDTKRFEDSTYLDLYATYLQSKYENTFFDVIISTDNAAYDFLVKNQQCFVKETPVVFCGVNYLKGHVPDGFTGIIEDIDIQSNIQVIISNHPNYKNVNIIIDRSITGKMLYGQTIEVIEDKFPSLRYEFIRDYSYSELKQKLASLSSDEIVLLLIFNYDRNGLVIPYDDILEELTPYCKVPIYGVWDFYLEKGIVGGKITSAYHHGQKAGQIANEILNGKKVSEIKVESGPTKFIFDYPYLKKNGVRIIDLSRDAIVLNSPTSLIVKHKEISLLILLVFLLLLVSIIFLLKSNRRKRKLLGIKKVYVKKIQAKNEALNEALSESRTAHELQKAFFANVSHEIRTPLNVILGFSDLLYHLNSHDEVQGDYAQFIKDNGMRLLAIIDNLIEISRIDSNQVVIQEVNANLNKMLDGLFATYSLVVQKGKAVQVVLNKELPDGQSFIKIDEVKLMQILRNLLDNAIKFTPSGVIEFGYRVKDEMLCFYVEDSGIGIAKSSFQYIFNRFGQVESGYNRKYEGSGLGLPITKTYVEKMGGQIELESTLNEGSRFSFTLPYKKEGGRKIEEGNTDLYLPNSTILIVDDEEANLCFFEALFNKSVVNTKYARNGKEAVELCRNSGDIDVILMDIKMPVMNGIDAATEIRALHPSLPIIFQTAQTDMTLDQIDITGDHLDILYKPVDRERLFGLITENVGVS